MTLLLIFIHLSFLLYFIYIARNKDNVYKAFVFLYLFYTFPIVFSSEITVFKVFLEYSPEARFLYPYIITDVFLIILMTADNLGKPSCRTQSLRYGEMLLYFISLFAVINFYYSNIDYLFVSKNIYIDNLASMSPNLFIISIPAETILVGAGFFSPFNNLKMRRLCVFLAVVIVLMSFVMGYRHLLFLSLLLSLFKIKRMSIIFVLLFFSFFGNFSDVIKYASIGFLYEDSYSFSENLAFVSSNIERYINFSGEQTSIIANLSIGMESLNHGAISDIVNLFPLASGFDIEWGAETTSRLGRFVGVSLGQGTAYNFQLFVLETYGLALIFLFAIFFIFRKFRFSIFSVYILEVFYSILRNGPAYYSGQIKMLVILIFITIVSGLVIKQLMIKKHIREADLD